MAVSHDDVRNIASLARVAVDPARLDAIAAELSGILTHMDALAEVAPPSVVSPPVVSPSVVSPSVVSPSVVSPAVVSPAVVSPAVVSPPVGMRLSPDSGPSVPLARSPSEFAPEWRDGFFLVPRLATHTDAGAVADDTE